MGTAESAVKRVLRLREAGHVERCHTLPHHDRYSVATHCYNMAALISALHPDPSANLYRAIVYHDAHERWTGDIPGALKYLRPDLAATLDHEKERIDALVGYEHHLVALSPDDRKWLKAVDRIEFYLWCEDQLALGNRHVGGRLEAVKVQLTETPMPPPCQAFLDAYQWHRTGDNDVR